MMAAGVGAVHQEGATLLDSLGERLYNALGCPYLPDNRGAWGMPGIFRVRKTRPVLLALAWALFLAGCTIGMSGSSTRLKYTLPTTISVGVGKNLPGSDIRYERMSAEGAYVMIKGQRALKRKGDSLDWDGTPVPGASVRLRLRVAWYTEQELYLVGTAQVTLEAVRPRVVPIVTTAQIKVSGPVAYSVSKGGKIPGCTYSYEGRTDDGAILGGVDGYPYRKAGDSIFWEGELSDGAYARLDLRAIQFDDRGLRVGGMATLWVGP